MEDHTLVFSMDTDKLQIGLKTLKPGLDSENSEECLSCKPKN